MTNEDPAGGAADLIVIPDGEPSSRPHPSPEDTAPEWWVAMSFEADDEDPERIGRIPESSGAPPAPELGPRSRTYGMLTLAAFLGVLVFAGLLTRVVG